MTVRILVVGDGGLSRRRRCTNGAGGLTAGHTSNRARSARPAKTTVALHRAVDDLRRGFSFVVPGQTDCLYRVSAIGRMTTLKGCWEAEADVMSMDDRSTGLPERPGSRRLTRSRTDRRIAGVCGGLAAYSGIDANVVRLAMVVLALLGGSGVVLYLVAWAIVPKEDIDGAS